MKNNILSGPLEIVFNITNRCNLNCIHCFNNSGRKEENKQELSDNEVIDFMSEVIKIHPFNLCFSGGEPLLRKELLLKCAKLLSSTSIRTNIVTNGWFIDKTTAEELKLAGIQDIEISLDGNTSETHERLRRTKNSFEKVIKAFEHLREINFPIYEASFTITSFSANKLLDVVDLLIDLKVPFLFVRPMLVIGRANEFVSQLVPSEIQYRNIHKEILELKYKKETQIQIEFSDPLSHIFIFKKEHYYGIEVKADGTVIISPYIQIPIGNIRRHSLQEYWDAGIPMIWQHPYLKDEIQRIYSPTSLFNSNKAFDLIEGMNKL